MAVPLTTLYIGELLIDLPGPPHTGDYFSALATSVIYALLLASVGVADVSDKTAVEKGGKLEIPADPTGEYALSTDPDNDDAYRTEFEAASRAIAGGAAPTFGRADAVDQAAAIEAVRRAAATGTRIDLLAT